MSNLSKNTWTLNEWYQQAEAGNVDYQGAGAGYYWGFGAGGQSGMNNNTKRSSPTQVTSPSPGGWKNINTNDYNTSVCGVKNDHTLWTWGQGDHGKLGYYVQNQYGETPSNANRSSPIQVPGQENVDRALSGEPGTFFRTREGNLFYMGGKYGGISGQNNSNIRYSSPIQIPGTWSEAWDFAQDGPILAVKTNGTLWSWGLNQRGAQAQNQSVPENIGMNSSPTQIGFNDNWATHQGAVAATPAGGAAITKDGELFVWGRNEAGRCGPISPGAGTEGYSSPVQVPIGTTYEPWHTVVSSNYSTIAIRKDHSMWGWGTPYRGALGIDSLAPSPDDQVFKSPMRIGPSSEYEWAAIAPLFSRNAARHAIKVDGTLWAWGQNEWGQTALNNVSPWGPSSPTQVPGTNWNVKNPPRGNRVKCTTKDDPAGG